MPIWVAHVGADLLPMVFGRGQEFRAPGPPILVDSLNVGHSHVQESTRAIRIWRRLERDCRFVVGGATAFVEDQPRVGYFHDDRIPFDQDLAIQ
jgi:hypothetical protein